ncbi:hypothetical protein BLA29_003633 [Euroglyphus maynei]|uniref:ACAD9/ACADV-like C-terminal domain-containing protein n=1 Tax=Euroglyphus maynei TaxID=6958 RepID=A0A1Y3B0M2_EURMA|nr:hypothetical protein BLA29_003633 [Euroglyphus maynei]
MLLASYGLRSVGRWRYDHIVRLRLNRIYPLHYMKYQFARFRRRFHLRYGQAYDGFKSLQDLNPLLKDSANRLEKVLETETMMADYILRLYGKECVKNQIDMNRFCSITVNAFQMVSVISRTNDSLSRGSRFATQQLRLCESICRKAHQEVNSLEKLIEGIEEIAEERRTKTIHQSNMRFDGYFARPTFDRVV